MLRLPVVGCFVLALAGCSEPDTIATYKVPKLAPVPDAVRRAVPEYRVLGAIIPDGKGQSWFFLMQGKASDIAPHAEAFDGLLKGLKFTDGLEKPPTWVLPKGWAEDKLKNTNTAMPRIVTFYPNGDNHELEISLTRFGGDLIGNVNRWRGKVGAAGVEEADLKTAAPEFKVESGQTGYKVDVTGKKDPTAGGMPGMMRPKANG